MVNFDAEDLKDSEDFCFRGSDVGKRTSWSPQHGIAAHDSRFSGPNDLYQPLSANQFRKHYNSLYWRKAQLHDGVENHVMGGWYEDRAEFYTRAIIPWISTTCSFKWAIWEIARRLSTSRGAHSTYDLSVIKRRLYIPSAYRGSKMIGLEAEQVLQAIPTDLRNDRAINFARSSSEILWYGRIFLKDIYETTKWTVTVSHLFYSNKTSRTL